MAGSNVKFVVKKDGKIMSQTDFEECIPNEAERKALRDGGYTIYLDGKAWKK